MSESKMFTMVIQEVPPGKMFLNNEDAKSLGLDVGDLCHFIEEETDESCVARVIIDNDVSSECFAINENMADSIGAAEGFEYLLKKYTENLDKQLEKVVIGVSDAGTQLNLDIENILLEKKKNIESFLQKKIIQTGLKILYEDAGIILEIDNTVPKLDGGEYAILQEVEIELYPVIKAPFNGILLVDMSKSMEEEDIQVDDSIKQALVQLHKMADNNLPNVELFLSKIETRQVIKRIESAILAGILFFAEKVARGAGEKISLIIYSNSAHSIEFNIGNETTPWLDISKGGLEDEKEVVAMILAAALLSKINKVKSGHTNMGKALLEAKKIIENIHEFEMKAIDHIQPTMVILLTDGEFDVHPSPIHVMKKEFPSVEKIVVHTVGIGNDIDKAVLKRIAELGHGEFLHAQNLTELLEFYSSLARRFKVISKIST